MPAVRALYELSMVSDAVAQSRPGDFFFAHLLIPHYPYIYDAGCNERNQADWELWQPTMIRCRQTQCNHVQRRYALYFEQVQCTYKKLGEMFDKWQRAGVFEDATIIIQGDHGSRINLNRPQASNVEQMLISDYADLFSTLLAVKAPGYEPGYDLRRIAIQDILPQLAVQGQSRAEEQGEPARLTSQPGVGALRLPGRRRPGPMARQPLPSFGDRRRRTAEVSQLWPWQ